MNPIEPFAFTRIDYVINLIAPHKNREYCTLEFPIYLTLKS